MNKHLIIQGLAALAGLTIGAATAYYSKDPAMSTAMGAVVYGVGAAFGAADPTVKVPTVPVTTSELDAAVNVIKDFHDHRTTELGNDVIIAVQQLGELLKATQAANAGATAAPVTQTVNVLPAPATPSDTPSESTPGGSDSP